ncbi:amidohydrolase family protein [Actinokineospora auranticolor]|uniref:metal-dependent hydrolase family protein n=1 Tax=Actinokineospora auranticolor TaxID=155976 RepID=UPI0011B04AD8|nr:amidohydrolase family protein [Actinokineospora auranticolor]
MLLVDRALVRGDGPEVVGAAIAVRGGVITAIGGARDVLADHRGGTVLDHRGHTALPGFVDAHVHLVFDGGPDPVGAVRAADPRALAAASAARAETLVRHGVTTARDLGDRDGIVRGVRDGINAGRLLGPRLLTAGSPITPTGGHCWFLGGVADGVEQVRAAVLARVAEGADLVKVMATGGTLTPGGPPNWASQYGVAELRAAVDVAHAHGLPVAAHAHGLAGVADAIAAGVDTIEHCTLPAGPDTDASPARADAVLRAAAKAGIGVCPTLHGGLADLPELLAAPGFHALVARIGRMRRWGVPLLAGTDAGVPGAAFDRFAGSLRWFTEAGLTAPEVLRLATSDTAAAVGVGDRTGALAVGLDADIVVVADDPRANLSTLDEPILVLSRGRVVTGQA